MKYYFNILDLFPYFILFTLICFIIENKKRNLFYLVIVVIVFLSIRYGVGYDYYEYKECIQYPGVKQFEPIAQALINFTSSIHYQWFFVITTVITIVPVYIVSKRYSIMPILSFMIYMLVPMFFLDGMSTIRNSIAYPMILLAFMILLRERKKYLSVIPVIISLGFHNSAIIALAILPLAFITFKRRTAFFFWVVSFIISQAHIVTLLENYLDLPYISRAAWYLLNTPDNHSGRTLWIVVNIINLVNFYYWNKLKAQNIEVGKFLMVYNLGCILYNLTISIEPTFALRLSNYCSIFLMLIAPYYVYVLPWGIARNKRYIYLFFIIYFCSIFFVVIHGTPAGERISFLPYQTFFSHID